MKKVVLVNQSSGYLMIDIVNAFVNSGNYEDVVLIAGSIKVTERILSKVVKVDKIVAYNRSSVLKRFLTWSIGSLQIFNKLLFKYRKYEVVYVTNPPMAYLSSLVLNNPFSIIVYDSYPDALVEAGIKKAGWIFQKWSSWNTKLFSRANKVVTLSEGMALGLSIYVDYKKITVISNWSSTDKLLPITKENNCFVQKYGLEHKFVILYSGNMGYTHSVEVIIELAKKLKDNSYVHFMFIGDGGKKEELLEDANKSCLKNCTFLDWQPVEILPYSLASADLAVITLNAETALVSVPSKTYNLLAVGAPLMCIAPHNSEISNLVNKYQNGKCFECTEIDQMVDFITQLSTNNEYKNRLSHNSIIASKDFTYKNASLYV